MSVVLYEDPKVSRMNSELKKARTLKGLTQEELAMLSEVNVKSIAAYEQNPSKLSNASLHTAYCLADALGCDILDIINKETLV